MSVASLAEKMNVSALTMRRDLDSLQEQGIITRQYGSARLATGEGGTTQTQERAKTAIARAAAKYVEDDETIFINTSTTALAIVPFITAENVTIITNNGKALQMPLRPTTTILLTGGEIRIPKWSMSAPSPYTLCTKMLLSVTCHTNLSTTTMGIRGLLGHILDRPRDSDRDFCGHLQKARHCIPEGPQ